MDDLTGTPGLVALGAAAVALLALLLAIVSAVRLRRVRRDQKVVLGEENRDLGAHAAALTADFAALHEYVEDAMVKLHERMENAEARLDGALTHRSLVRYDAYGEMSGQQSTTLALLDATRSGVVLSAIHHRDHARLYAKQVRDGQAELQLSPEEDEAVRSAMRAERPPAG